MARRHRARPASSLGQRQSHGCGVVGHRPFMSVICSAPPRPPPTECSHTSSLGQPDQHRAARMPSRSQKRRDALGQYILQQRRHSCKRLPHKSCCPPHDHPHYPHKTTKPVAPSSCTNPVGGCHHAHLFKTMDRTMEGAQTQPLAPTQRGPTGSGSHRRSTVPPLPSRRTAQEGVS